MDDATIRNQTTSQCMSLSLPPDRPRHGPNISGCPPVGTKSPTSLSKGDAMSSQDGHFTKCADQSKKDCSETHDLHERIALQLEYYLSDEYLGDDGFLLKHVQKNRLGYVSLKLLTSFKKMKELTRDWRVTLAGARCSEVLEVNEEGTKVRRQEPVPKWLLCAPTSKLLLAWNLFGEHTTGEDLDQPRVLERALRLFSMHGNVTSLRILRPGKELPVELRRHAKRHAVLGQRVCAMVEFDSLEGARRAYDALRAEEQASEGRGVCVAPLGGPGSRSSRSNREGTAEEGEEDPEGCPEVKLGQKKQNSKCLISLVSSMEDSVSQKSSESGPGPGPGCGSGSGSGSALGPSTTRPPRRVQRHKSLDSPLASQSSSPFRSSPGLNRSGVVGVGRSRCSGDYVQENMVSPWVLRRKVAAGTAHPEDPGQLRRPSLPQRVVRQPLGPDDTKGFYANRGRGMSIQPR